MFRWNEKMRRCTVDWKEMLGEATGYDKKQAVER